MPLTYFLAHLSIIAFSIFFQIKYLKFKRSESPEIDLSRLSANLPTRVSDLSNTNNQLSFKEDDEALLGNRNEDNSVNTDEGECDDNGEINDQED